MIASAIRKRYTRLLSPLQYLGITQRIRELANILIFINILISTNILTFRVSLIRVEGSDKVLNRGCLTLLI